MKLYKTSGSRDTGYEEDSYENGKDSADNRREMLIRCVEVFYVSFCYRFQSPLKQVSQRTLKESGHYRELRPDS